MKRVISDGITKAKRQRLLKRGPGKKLNAEVHPENPVHPVKDSSRLRVFFYPFLSVFIRG